MAATSIGFTFSADASNAGATSPPVDWAPVPADHDAAIAAGGFTGTTAADTIVNIDYGKPYPRGFKVGTAGILKVRCAASQRAVSIPVVAGDEVYCQGGFDRVYISTGTNCLPAVAMQ